MRSAICVRGSGHVSNGEVTIACESDAIRAEPVWMLASGAAFLPQWFLV